MKFNYLSHVWWHITMTQLVAESGESCFWDRPKIYSRIPSWKIKTKSLNFPTYNWIYRVFFFSVWLVKKRLIIFVYIILPCSLFFTYLLVDTFIASTSWPLWIFLRIWYAYIISQCCLLGIFICCNLCICVY